MSWKCIKGIADNKQSILFEVNNVYQEQDDRGEADDIAICLLDEKGQKQYLINNWVREFFIEIK